MLYNASLMNAVILIGGRGTRLRPFTLDTPKPLLPVLNRPFLHYQFDVLKKHGVRHAILCTSYKPNVFRELLGTGRSHGLKLEYVHEEQPLGTGGALRNALDKLDDTTLVLNGDVLNKLDVSAFVAQHRRKAADVSLALTRVKDPTLYGVVETGPDGRVRKFVEKPSWDEVESNTINAGAYLFERQIITRIPAGTIYSLERSLFPQLLLEGKRLFGYVSTGYWIDIGTVEKYLQVHLDLLKEGKPLRGKGAVVHPLAHLGGRVCLGSRVRVGKGARLEDCVVLDGAVIGDGARLERCVVGPGCRVGAGAVLGSNVALAGGSRVGAFSQL
jgi:mannose-1-phosphate guanylyltransferase